MLLDVIDRVDRHRPRPFVAPIPDAGRVTVFTVQDNIPYYFAFRSPEPGWYVVQPASQTRARLGESAQPCDILEYLAELPRFYVISCFRLSEATWLCVPYNASDAAQRGWPKGEPRPLHLVRHSIRPLETLVARSLAGTMLYDDIEERGLPAPFRLIDVQDLQVGHYSTDVRNAVMLVLKRRMELEKESRQKALEEAKWTTEGEIRYQLEFMGADLLAWSEAGEGYEVKWSYDGCEYSMRIRRDMRVESAGICLDRTDTRHNLSSIVNVMEEARKLRRFDLDEEYYL